ncbi:hypothetical protein HYX10_05945 [Candidatus Woesearchaeota archaeon]|nr:hypothetical protein [Candidatus Woesearchaeota archaeon]
MSDKAELLRYAGKLRSEISKLRHEIGSVSFSRRSLYTKLDELKKPFYSLIDKIRELRSKRDEHTSAVRALKGEREAASSEAKAAVTDLHKFAEEKDKMSRKLGVRKSASSLAEEINRLEFRIETGAIPFEEEKRLTKIIKEKKAELKKAEQLSDVVRHLKSSSHKLLISKSESDQAHQQLRLHASVSQKLHSEMLAHAKKADELKQQIKPVEAELTALKQKNSELKKQLDQKAAELNSLQAELDRINAEEERLRKLEEQKQLEAKEQELTEKIRSGKKLTMDDLIKLQKS